MGNANRCWRRRRSAERSTACTGSTIEQAGTSDALLAASEISGPAPVAAESLIEAFSDDGRCGDDGNKEDEASTENEDTLAPLPGDVGRAVGLSSLSRSLVRRFLETNGFADVNARRRRWNLSFAYPLHVAVDQNSSTIVDLLLKSRADPHVKNSSGRSAEELASDLDKNGSHAAVLAAFVPRCLDF
eukprot:TRINITY_DN64129_c0_g1_i1.p1 TRINITY_DN64129_c0_g1~~TRINITY_DN64129_c0_g1_i1.p1  ORF type:complete len:195 (-),score=35.31 TRINITY_DN64129_c0_g1_i1:110-670(-)